MRDLKFKVFHNGILKPVHQIDFSAKEIYENDIVICDGRRAKCLFEKGEFKYKPEFTENYSYCIDYAVEVIGNIYENPELLSKN